MPADNDVAQAGVRIPGLYAGLIAHQAAAVIRPDVRLYDWNAADITASKDRVTDEARKHPRRSTLFDKLRDRQPVTIEWLLARPFLSADDQPIMAQYFRVFPDDRVEAAEGPPDQCAS